MKNFLIICLSLICNSYVNAQQPIYIYVSTIPNGMIYSLENSNSTTLIVALDENNPVYGDIAVGPAGELYGITADGKVYEINLNTGESIFAFEFPFIICTSLVCDSDYNFYTIDVDGEIYSYSLNDNTWEVLYDLDDFTSGDVAFFNGYIVYPSTNNPEYLQAFSLQDNSVTTIYCFPLEILELNSFFGITNRFDSCGNEMLVIASSDNDYYEIDVYNNSYVNLDVSLEIINIHETFGLASSSDIEASQCDGFVPQNDCAVGIDNYSSKSENIPFYPNPVTDELNFIDPTIIRGLTISDVSGKVVKSIYKPNNQELVNSLRSGLYFVTIEYLDREYGEYKLIVD